VAAVNGKVGPFRTDDPRELRRQLELLERKLDLVTQQLSAKGPEYALQYNDGSRPAGSESLHVEDGTLALYPDGSIATPRASVRLGAQEAHGRVWPVLVHSGGASHEVERQWAGSDLVTVLGVTGSATFTSLGGAPTNVGTLTARTVATTNLLTRRRRTALVSAAAAGSLASQRIASGVRTTGDGTGVGGFYYLCLFAASDAAAVAGARMFVGLSNASGAATNVEPSTLINSVGVAQLSTDTTQLYLCYGGSTAQAAIPLGPLTAPWLGAAGVANGSLFKLELWSPGNELAAVYYRLCNCTNGFVASGKVVGASGVTLPAPTTTLTIQSWRTNNATALAVGLDLCETWVRTP